MFIRRHHKFASRQSTTQFLLSELRSMAVGDYEISEISAWKDITPAERRAASIIDLVLAVKILTSGGQVKLIAAVVHVAMNGDHLSAKYTDEMSLPQFGILPDHFDAILDYPLNEAARSWRHQSRCGRLSVVSAA